MTKGKTGPQRPASSKATPGGVADLRPPKLKKRSTDSATGRRSALPALVAFMQARHAALTSAEGDRLLALRGDTMAAREIIDRFAEAVRGHRIGGVDAESWADLRVMSALATMILAQPAEALATVLGYQGLRSHPAKRIADLVIFGAVDHAQFNMGEVRTLEDASAMVATASTRLVGTVFAAPISNANARKIYQRLEADDVNGRPALLQRAERMRDN